MFDINEAKRMIEQSPEMFRDDFELGRLKIKAKLSPNDDTSKCAEHKRNKDPLKNVIILISVMLCYL